MFSSNIGIYKIINTIDNKFYIGSSLNIKSRIYKHKNKLRLNKHDNIYLQRAWNKYKEDCFKFEVVLYCLPEFLRECEQEYINKYIPFKENDCYNLKEQVLYVPRHTDLQISNQVKAQIGRKCSQETKKKISISLKGRVVNKPEHYIKLSEKFKGRTVKEETRRKIKEGHSIYFKLYDLEKDEIVENFGIVEFAKEKNLNSSYLSKLHRGIVIAYDKYMTCNIDSLKEILVNNRRQKYLKKYDLNYRLFEKIKKFIETYNDNSC